LPCLPSLSRTLTLSQQVVIDGDEEQNKNPQPHTEADEFIEVLYAPVEGLLGFLEGLCFCICHLGRNDVLTCLK